MYTCCKLSISTRDSNVLLNTRIIQNWKNHSWIRHVRMNEVPKF
jgi:hypothetical protein